MDVLVSGDFVESLVDSDPFFSTSLRTESPQVNVRTLVCLFDYLVATSIETSESHAVSFPMGEIALGPLHCLLFVRNYVLLLCCVCRGRRETP